MPSVMLLDVHFINKTSKLNRFKDNYSNSEKERSVCIPDTRTMSLAVPNRQSMSSLDDMLDIIYYVYENITVLFMINI